MIRFGAYILLCICLTISLWFFGFQSPLTYVLGITPNNGQALDANGNPVTIENAYPTSFDNQQDDNLVKYQLETFDDVIRLARTFRGEIYNPTSKLWESR